MKKRMLLALTVLLVITTILLWSTQSTSEQVSAQENPTASPPPTETIPAQEIEATATAGSEFIATPVPTLERRRQVQTITETIADPSELDVYLISGLQAGATLYVFVEATASSTLDTVVSLKNEAATLIENDDFRGTNAGFEYAILRDGDYVLQVNSFAGNSFGEYVLTVGVNEPSVLDGSASAVGDEFVTLAPELPAAPVDEGPAVEPETVSDEGRVQATTGELVSRFARDVYIVQNANPGDRLFAYVESVDGQLDTVLQLWNGTFDTLVLENDDFIERNSGFEVRLTEPGNYFLVISSYNQDTQGRYRLLAGINAPEVLTGSVQSTESDLLVYDESRSVTECVDETLDILSIANASSDEVPQVQLFTDALPFNYSYHVYDIYDVEAGDTIYVRADASCSGLDPAVELIDIEGNVIAANDDFFVTSSALELVVEQAGQYALRLSNCCGFSSGDYRLAIGINEPATFDVLAPVYALDTIAALNPNLSYDVRSDIPVQILTEQSFENRSFPVNYYTINSMTAGDTLYLYVDDTGSTMDPFIRVRGPEDKILLENDDGGIGLDATGSLVLPLDGTYTLEVISCCGVEPRGDYALTVGLNAPHVLNGNAPDTGDILIFDSVSKKSGPPSRITTAQGSLQMSSAHFYSVAFTAQENDRLYVQVTSVEGNGNVRAALWQDLGGGEFSLLTFSEPSESEQKAELFEYPVTTDTPYIIGIDLIEPLEGDRLTLANYELSVGLNRPDVIGRPFTGEADRSRELQPKFRTDLSYSSPTRFNVIERTMAFDTAEMADLGVAEFDLIALGEGDTVTFSLELADPDNNYSATLFFDIPSSARDATQLDTMSGESFEFSYRMVEAVAAPKLYLSIYPLVLPEDGLPAAPIDYTLSIGINQPTGLNEEVEPTAESVLRGEEPTVVDVGLELLQITEVDQKKENFSVVAVLRAEWNDPSQVFHPADNNGSRLKRFSNEQQIEDFFDDSDIQWPQFFIDNQQDERSIQSQVILLRSDGTITYEERFAATLQAPEFDFLQFPFDSQNFTIDIRTVFSADTFVLDERSAFRVIGDQLGEEEWQVVDSNGVVEEVDGTSEYRFGLDVTRQRNFYIFRILVPLGLIIFMGWMIVLFVNDAEVRVAASSGNLLLLIAFNFTIGDDLPRLGYLTFLDMLLLLAFIIATFIFIVDVVLFYVGKRMEDAEKRWEESLRTMSAEERDSDQNKKISRELDRMQERWRGIARFEAVAYFVIYIGMLLGLWLYYF